MPARFCPVCDIKMVAEYDHELDSWEPTLIWHCTECGRTHVQGEDDDDE